MAFLQVEVTMVHRELAQEWLNFDPAVTSKTRSRPWNSRYVDVTIVTFAKPGVT